MVEISEEEAGGRRRYILPGFLIQTVKFEQSDMFTRESHQSYVDSLTFARHDIERPTTALQNQASFYNAHT